MDNKQDNPNSSSYIQPYEELRRQQAATDEQARTNPALARVMVDLIADIGDLLERHAARLADAKTPDNLQRFDVDDQRELLAWQLCEFVNLAHISRDDETYTLAARAHQYTRQHAGAWFAAASDQPDQQPYDEADEQARYPMHDTDSREIENMWVHYAGDLQQRRYRYQLGESLISVLLPGLRRLLADTAQHVLETGHFETTVIAHDLTQERLIHMLALMLAGGSVEVDNVARPHWLTEEFARLMLTLPKAE